MPDAAEVAKINDQGQAYFVPYYCEIVDQHPEGIDSREVKAQVRQLLIDRFEVDILDPDLFGWNQNGSRADQWANNLVSNYVLDEYMLVAHRGRGRGATLWPGTVDNSIPPPTPPTGLDVEERTSLDERTPTVVATAPGRAYRRSVQLAEHVRAKNGHRCAIAGDGCAEFEGRDGRPYIEVHHIVPMAFQAATEINLDRTTNMAPLCVGCHKRIHGGSAEVTARTVEQMLRWFETRHGAPFEVANGDLGLGVSGRDLLAMYGLMS
jgi:hypothetical protein